MLLPKRYLPFLKKKKVHLIIICQFSGRMDTFSFPKTKLTFFEDRSEYRKMFVYNCFFCIFWFSHLLATNMYKSKTCGINNLVNPPSLLCYWLMDIQKRFILRTWNFMTFSFYPLKIIVHLFLFKMADWIICHLLKLPMQNQNEKIYIYKKIIIWVKKMDLLEMRMANFYFVIT